MKTRYKEKNNKKTRNQKVPTDSLIDIFEVIKVEWPLVGKLKSCKNVFRDYGF